MKTLIFLIVILFLASCSDNSHKGSVSRLVSPGESADVNDELHEDSVSRFVSFGGSANVNQELLAFSKFLPAEILPNGVQQNGNRCTGETGSVVNNLDSLFWLEGDSIFRIQIASLRAGLGDEIQIEMTEINSDVLTVVFSTNQDRSKYYWLNVDTSTKEFISLQIAVKNDSGG